ncbi:zinc finger protein 112 [Trichonephila clavipes]|nr:zinc finger protein 112 [Trichonephila clavipes]
MDETNKCYICIEESKTNKFLNNQPYLHIRQKRPIKKCDRAFAERNTVDSDILNHSGRKLLDDHNERKKLKRILRIRANERRFTCEICSKVYSTLSHLKNYLRIHTKEKPYSCEICYKAFSQNGDLKIHLRVHTKEQPFICEICNKSFS